MTPYYSDDWLDAHRLARAIHETREGRDQAHPDHPARHTHEATMRWLTRDLRTQRRHLELLLGLASDAS